MYDNDVYKRYIHQCGGSIINKYQILTAAHCFQKSQNPQDWIVISGRNNFYMRRLHRNPNKGRLNVTENLENVFEPKEIILHGGYREVDFANDIAIINLKQPLKLTEKPIGSIKLASKPPNLSDKCKVAGWGSISRDTRNSRSYPYDLHEASVQMRDFDQCRVNYFLLLAKNKTVENFSEAELKRAKDLWFYVQAKQNICAGNEKTDSCAADSGGPMICKDPDTKEFVLSGIVSWGKSCALQKYPGVYSNVAYFKYWIDDQVKLFQLELKN